MAHLKLDCTRTRRIGVVAQNRLARQKNQRLIQPRWPHRDKDIFAVCQLWGISPRLTIKNLACIRCAGLAGQAAQRRVPLLKRAGLPLTSLMEYHLLRATIRGLRLHVPAAYPTVVRSGAKLPPDTDAYCTRTKSRFLIMLGQHLGPKAATEAVVHEWAHARAWNHRHDQAVATLRAARNALCSGLPWNALRSSPAE